MRNATWEYVVGWVKGEKSLRFAVADAGVDVMARVVCWAVAYGFVSRDTRVPNVDLPPGMSPARFLFEEWLGDALSLYQPRERLHYILSRIRVARELRAGAGTRGDPPAVDAAVPLSEADDPRVRRGAAPVI